MQKASKSNKATMSMFYRPLEPACFLRLCLAHYLPIQFNSALHKNANLLASSTYLATIDQFVAAD